MDERKQMRVVLASASSRRLAWLNEEFVNLELTTQPLVSEENAIKVGIPVSNQAESTCLAKAMAASREWTILGENGKEIPHLIIVADTIVEDPDDEMVPLGKPANQAEAATMLLRLSGARHRVWSSSALIYPKDERGSERLHAGWSADIWTESAIVEFPILTENELVHLIESNSWKGKAGAYDLAGHAGKYAKLIEGNEVTVLGLAPGAIAELGKLVNEC